MSATYIRRRQALIRNIDGILDDYLGGRIDHTQAGAAVAAIFSAPTCRVAVADIARYLNRVLEMVRTGDMSRAEAVDKLVDMEMSFENEDAFA